MLPAGAPPPATPTRAPRGLPPQQPQHRLHLLACRPPRPGPEATSPLVLVLVVHRHDRHHHPCLLGVQENRERWTTTLPLLSRGIILRIRRNEEDGSGESTVKLCGPEGSVDPKLWRERTRALGDDATIEGDWAADRRLRWSPTAHISCGGCCPRLRKHWRPTCCWGLTGWSCSTRSMPGSGRRREAGRRGRRRAVGTRRWLAVPGAVHTR